MEARAETMTRAAGVDPVCGMTVDADDATTRWQHGGKNHVFCSAHCLAKFKADAARYAASAIAPAAALLLVCPAMLLWGAIQVALDERRQRRR